LGVNRILVGFPVRISLLSPSPLAAQNAKVIAAFRNNCSIFLTLVADKQEENAFRSAAKIKGKKGFG
jgi:hypothetical protein